MNLIFGFMHAATLGHWQAVDTELLDGMLTSGLLHECISLNIGIVGDENRKYWEPWSMNSTITYNYLGDLKEYEYATLQWLQDSCINCLTNPKWRQVVGIDPEDSVYVFYCCNAGVSHKPNHDLYPDWRWLMSYFNHFRWRDCVKALDEGYDTVGIEWQTDPVSHWSGNFWWATAEYITTLPDVKDMKTFDAGNGIGHKTHPRHGAEFWIGRNPNVKYKSLFQTGYSWRERPRKSWCGEL